MPFKGKKFDLEREALLASGIKEKNRLDLYKEKLDYLCQRFLHEMEPTIDPIVRGRLLFNWLWTEKPARYKSHGNYLFNDVIDAQLSEVSQNVGNCLGLTLLYNCLLERMNMEPEALYLEDAFGIGPHVLTLLPAEESSIDIENIMPDGFDCKGHLDNSSRTRWGDRELVSDIYHSLGNDSFEKEEWGEALKNFEMAIYLNPCYEKAHLNKMILLERSKQG